MALPLCSTCSKSNLRMMFFPQSLASAEALFYPILFPTLLQHTLQFMQAEIFFSPCPISLSHICSYTHMYTYVHPCTLLQLHSQCMCFQHSMCKSYPCYRHANVSPFLKTVTTLYSALLGIVKIKVRST